MAHCPPHRLSLPTPSSLHFLPPVGGEMFVGGSWGNFPSCLSQVVWVCISPLQVVKYRHCPVHEKYSMVVRLPVVVNGMNFTCR